MIVYSLFDRKVKEYGNLVVASNDEAILRAAREGIAGSGSTAAKYPEDFDLMRVGSFDPESGLLGVETPRLVANVGELLRPGGV